MGKKNKKKKRENVASFTKDNSTKQSVDSSNRQDNQDTECSVSASDTTANSSSDVDVVLSSESNVNDRKIESSDSGRNSQFQQSRPRKFSRNIDESEVTKNEMKDISHVNQKSKQQYDAESNRNSQDKLQKTNSGKSSDNHSRSYSRERKRNNNENYKQDSSNRWEHSQNTKKGYNSRENSNSYVSQRSSGDKNNWRHRDNDESKLWSQSKTPDQKQGNIKSNSVENADLSIGLWDSWDDSNKLRDKSNDRSNHNHHYKNNPILPNRTSDQEHVKVKSSYGENSDSLSWNSHKFRNKSSDRSKRYREKSESNARSSNKIPDQEYDKFKATYMLQKDSIDMGFKVVQETEGDLFTASTEYSLGHCVAEDMNMGSGIAVLFRREFKRVDELLSQRQTQGNVAILEDKERFIYYLVTKRASSGKPTYHTLWQSLQKMKEHITVNNVKKLALPRIGCGLDSLEWKWVKNMLEYIFQDIDIKILIYNFQQDSSSTPQGRLRKCHVVNTKKLLSEIESGTIMVYFGSEDGYETEEITDLSRKFPYIRNLYKSAKKVMGSHVYTEKHNDSYVFYGCIVRKKHTDLFSFIDFQKCLKSIQARNRKDKYEYIGIQAFLEEGSSEIVSKIVNLMRYAMTDVDVYVCWPENLSTYMPPV